MHRRCVGLGCERAKRESRCKCTPVADGINGRPQALPRHMFYLSYSADGPEQGAYRADGSGSTPEAGNFSIGPPTGALCPPAPATPEPTGPRAQVDAARDPLANSSQLGAAGSTFIRCIRF